MDFSTVNVGIVIVVYCIAEILKITLMKEDSKRAALPVICIVAGALVACAVFYFYPEGISSTNLIDAFGLGGMSGASAVGCNQIYKQFTKFSTGADDDTASST